MRQPNYQWLFEVASAQERYLTLAAGPAEAVVSDESASEIFGLSEAGPRHCPLL